MGFARGSGLIAALVLAGTLVRGQQDPMYSQYMFNVLAFNPAYAGSADVLTGMILSRHQWVGFDGAPSTQSLVMHSPLPGQTLSLGGSLMHDVAGPAKQTSAFLDAAYRIRTGKDTRLAFGLKGGINLFQADIASLTTVDAEPANVSISGKMLPNFGFGLFWHSNRYYIGLSSPKLLENTIGGDNTLFVSKEFRHFFAMGGYVMDLNRDLKFKPSFMLRAVQGAPMSLDLNANFLLRDKVWFGAMYRLGNAFGFMAQYSFNDQLRAGYAFDLTTNRIGAYNAGTHEVMLSYDFLFSQGRTISPRYF
jgi:type IX secretion system PorP/SprF family membrane protein